MDDVMTLGERVVVESLEGARGTVVAEGGLVPFRSAKYVTVRLDRDGTHYDTDTDDARPGARPL